MKAARPAAKSLRRLDAKLRISGALHFDKRVSHRSNSRGRRRCMSPEKFTGVATDLVLSSTATAQVRSALDAIATSAAVHRQPRRAKAPSPWISP
ncbi:MAG: hypothetical protein JF606_24960 [Burkholderiales bacterium]|nr:hypothetical protein [Burkholderiales bacterium]